MPNELTKPNEVQTLTEFKITQADALRIDEQFNDLSAVLKQLDEKYELVIKMPVTPELEETAKQLSKRYAKFRSIVDERHKTAKEYPLNEGRYCDFMKKSWYERFKPKETKLDEIAETSKMQAKKERDDLQQYRLNVLKEIDPDGEYKYEDLAGMKKDVWELYADGILSRIKKQKDDAKLLEEARVLKEKAEEEAKAKRSEELRKLNEENEKLRIEKDEAVRVAEEALANEQAMAKALEEKPAEIPKVSPAAPDKEKLQSLLDYFNKIQYPTMTTKPGMEAVAKVQEVVGKVKAFITKELPNIK